MGVAVVASVPSEMNLSTKELTLLVSGWLHAKYPALKEGKHRIDMNWKHFPSEVNIRIVPK